MTGVPPIPVVFEPIFKPKPWGGRKLATLLGKAAPADIPIGESWEVSDLPGAESRVARGPLAGKSIGQLIDAWGDGLTGAAELVDGRFPLLIKFLDAREKLSVQVHPKALADPAAPEPAGVKHEAWYVLDAEPDAGMYIGLKPGVGPEQVRAAGSSPALAELHQFRPVRRGDCFYLPSGTPHALGGGLLVAEVQTPSDVTYRLYDWGRLGLDGQPRELHVAQALENIYYDVPETEIAQPRSHLADVFATVTSLVRCRRFMIDKVRFCEGVMRELPYREMAVWIMLDGAARLVRDKYECELRPGDVVVIPAAAEHTRVETLTPTDLLEVRIPILSKLPARG